MTGNKCPFSIIQASGSCHCPQAREVVRRGGSEYDCMSVETHSLCSALVQHLNAMALPALGHEDDLTQTPRSVYERVMLGGLQGLRRARDPADNTLETTDIAAVVTAANDAYGGIEAIPAGVVVPAIEGCRIKRRQRRR